MNKLRGLFWYMAEKQSRENILAGRLAHPLSIAQKDLTKYNMFSICKPAFWTNSKILISNGSKNKLNRRVGRFTDAQIINYSMFSLNRTTKFRLMATFVPISLLIF